MAKRKTTRIQHTEIVGRFAARLRELRHSRGLTQAQLAEQAQITTSYVGRLESGEPLLGSILWTGWRRLSAPP